MSESAHFPMHLSKLDDINIFHFSNQIDKNGIIFKFVFLWLLEKLSIFSDIH